MGQGRSGRKGLPPHTKGRRIGLLGGSFNPAHGGHVHISQVAAKALKLDEIWWLVSPHNPLKAKESLASYQKRLQSAREEARSYRKIRVLDIEARWQLRYSWQTVRALQAWFPGTRFIWIMGADNLANFHRWRRWQGIMDAIPLAVLDRAPHSHRFLRSKAAQRGRRFQIKASNMSWLYSAPALCILHAPRDAASATALRKTFGEKAFLRHNKSSAGTH